MAIDETPAAQAEGETNSPASPASPASPPAEPIRPGAGEPEPAERLSAIEGAITEFNRRSAHREAVIDRLHEENQRLRGGLYRSLLEPVIADLIRMYDALLREAARLTAEDADPARGRLLESFADDALLTLERCGLEEFTARHGEPFDPARHTAVSVVPVDDEAKDKTVAEVVAVGFLERESGRVRRPVRARFHQFRPAAVAAGDREGAGPVASAGHEASADLDAPATPDAP